jgi:hypothetical protein
MTSAAQSAITGSKRNRAKLSATRSPAASSVTNVSSKRSSTSSGADRNGRYHLTEKGYFRYHSSHHRNRYVHRVIVEQKLGRQLRKDEDVHHRNGVKTDNRLRNLQILSHTEHGWVSAKQHWYMKRKEETDKKEWEEYFNVGESSKRTKKNEGRSQDQKHKD